MIRHELLQAVPHGFFTAAGGVSKGVYESLNVGLGSGDNTDNVKENRRICAESLGFSAADLVTPYQVHSNKCVFVESPQQALMEADAYVTDVKGLLLGVVTADCLPILLWEPCGLIGAAHGGWRGCVGGILDNTVAVMEAHGGKRDNIRAVIGPAIGVESYQVQADFHGAVTGSDKEAERFFRDGDDGYYFDLPAYGEFRLRRLGVGEVGFVDEDTCGGDGFFSYRRCCLRGNKDYGRQLSAIGLEN